MVGDWKIIQDNQQVNGRYNASLSIAFINNLCYTKFNKRITEVNTNTKTTTKYINNVWNHRIHDSHAHLLNQHNITLYKI